MSQTAAIRQLPDPHLADLGAGDEPAAACGTILVTGTGIDLSPLRPLALSLGLVLRRPACDHLSEDQLASELRNAVAYIHGGEERATERVLRAAKETLKVVAFLGVGYENFVDVAAADALGIVVTNTGGAATESVATFTVGQIINANWRITQSLGNRYPDWHGPEELPHELSTRTVGIVGMGAIGTRIAEIMKAFRALVVYFSRTRKEDVEERLGLEFLPLRDLAEQSDILVVMVPETDQTRGMIDADVLAGVRKGAILVNAARPAVVDPEALHDALRKETVAVAVFDGFYHRDSAAGRRLLEDFSDRLLVTGHIASHTREAMDRMVGQAARSIANVLSNGADEHAVGNHGGLDTDRPVKATRRPGGWGMFRSVPQSLRMDALIHASWYRSKRRPAARRSQP
jgi:glyoxylate reductase